MEKSKAKQLLMRQIAAINSVDGKTESSPEFARWMRDTEIAVEKIFGDSGRHLPDLRGIRFSPGAYYSGMPANANETKCSKGLAEAREILQSMVEELSDYGLDEPTTEARDSLSLLSGLFERFHLVARQLLDRHGGRATLKIEDEYDAQDLTHALLNLYFEDIRPEEWTPSYAGASSRMDFLLKQEKVVLEVKKTRKGLQGKEVGEQLIIDIEKYRSHPDCKTLVCFVYDPEGLIKNPRGLENDLNRDADGFKVHVIIAPKGT